MGNSAAMNNSRFLMNLRGDRKGPIIVLIFLSLFAVLIALLFKNLSPSPRSRGHQSASTSSLSPLDPIIKEACTKTLYSSFCLDAVSSIPPSKNTITFYDFLEFVISQTKNSVKSTRMDVLAQFESQDLSSQEKNAHRDCVEMLDQTLYELGQVIDHLRKLPSSSGYARGSYGNLKTLLSAAMTNENTCIDGFSDLEEFLLKGQKCHKERFQTLLTPISRMISNCLAMIKYMENIGGQETIQNPRMLITKVQEDRILDLTTNADRKMVETTRRMIPDVTVASDGSGNYTFINEAIAMAPNMSMKRYVIKINSGVYEEHVIIAREKINLMLIGDGRNKTIVKGSRNIVDGYSTFASATLTVIGDKFIARDLTIINTSGPEKHQAVALLVTSNAAFYRCEIISYQDTLFAHSLSQFYQDCTIQGTIDFIFGNAAAIFKNCLILVRKPAPRQKNMITAQGRADPNQNTGISLQNCTIKAAPVFTLADRKNFSTFLGRPWRNFSRTIIMNSYLDDLIDPQGWCTWDEYSTLNTVDYIEYMNSGPGSDTSRRVTWAGYRKNCSVDIARQFTVGEFLHEADYWLRSSLSSLKKHMNLACTMSPNLSKCQKYAYRMFPLFFTLNIISDREVEKDPCTALLQQHVQTHL